MLPWFALLPGFCLRLDFFYADTKPASAIHLVLASRVRFSGYRSICHQRSHSLLLFVASIPFALVAPFSCCLVEARRGLSASSPFSVPPFITSRSVSDMSNGSSAKAQRSLHDFSVKDGRGNDVQLSQYKGKVLIVVNVASQCGLTNSNYTELTQLYQNYKDKGLEILAFPCNQFGGQEPGTNEEIEQMVCTRFKAEFPIFDKVDVNGNNAAPVYKFLKSSKGGFFGDSIKWNFSKFLIDQEGRVVDRYAPTTSPLKIEKDIKKLLGI